MAELTKAQLQKQLEAAQAREAELQAELEAQRQANMDITRRGEGWLVTTPNPLFNESRHGIRFQDGQAFILKDQKVPDFEYEPTDQAKLMKHINAQYPKGVYTEKQREAEIKAILEREKRTSAELCVEALERDFGYQVEYFDAEKLLQLDERIQARVAERNQALAAQNAQENAMSFMPGY